MILLDQMVYFCPCPGPISHQINVWLLDTVHHKINEKSALFIWNTNFWWVFLENIDINVLFCVENTLSLYFLENALASPYLNVKKKFYFLWKTDLLLQIFRPQESKKKKEKENQETESQDHVGVRPGKGKTILNWASKFLRYSVPQIYSFIIV